MSYLRFIHEYLNPKKKIFAFTEKKNLESLKYMITKGQ